MNVATGVLTLTVIDGPMLVAGFLHKVVDVVVIPIQDAARLHARQDEGPDRLGLHIRQHFQEHLGRPIFRRTQSVSVTALHQP